MLDTPPDLAFAAVHNPASATLTQEQIAHHNREGYLTGLPALSPSEANANRASFDRLLAGLGREGAYAINCYQARSQVIWDLCTAPMILDVVEDLIGPNVVFWASHFFCKLPGDPKRVPWHQDAAFWHLAPARTVTVWLAIDDAEDGNAAMQFLPRSHDKGALDWRACDGGVLDKEIVAAERLGAPVTNALRAGEMSVHADMLAHGSAPNLSARRRCGLTIRYCPPEVRITNPVWAQGIEAILCRGADTSGHWRHHGRPRGDDVSLGNSPRNLGGN